jgi:hypothetical protein
LASLDSQDSAAIPLAEQEAVIQELGKSTFAPFQQISSKNDFFYLKANQQAKITETLVKSRAYLESSDLSK